MKKIISLLLILVLSIGLLNVGASAAKSKITGLTSFAVQVGSIEIVPNEDPRPGKAYEVAFQDVLDYFDYEGTAPTTQAALEKLLKTVDIRCRVRKGYQIIDSMDWDNVVFTPGTSGAATIRIELIDTFVSVEDTDFDIVLYFAIDGKRTDNEFVFEFSGTFGNEVTEVYSNSVEADSWEGQVIDAQEYVSKIILVGNEEEDVFAHIKMANGKKVYFVVNTDGDLKDEPIFDKYPSIEFAYTVLSVGMSGFSGNIIELAGVDESYYIYGKNADGTLKYLGRGGEMLPFSSKYYVSEAKLELEDTQSEPVLDDSPAPSDSDSGSYNPSTGR